MSDSRTELAADLMRGFADRTGLTSQRPSRRYLWTDAFAVCTFFAVARATGDDSYEALALDLVGRVHEELGRHRGDDGRSGWISGLSEDEGRARPTAGGLRIGKPLPERRPDEPFDPDLEWERDGQYFHYLTKWIHALDQAARFTGRAAFHLWARELADAAHRGFTGGPRGRRRMVWKASIDLSRPLVPTMGQHDPLDGLVTCRQLDTTAAALSIRGARPSLERAALDFEEMLDRRALATDDPLGLGGLLTDASRLAQIGGDEELRATLIDAAEEGLAQLVIGRELRAPIHRRLAFRELGLAIGLAATPLASFATLRREIEQVWSEREARRTEIWLEHEDIDDVMLATALVPEGFVVLPPPALTTNADSRRMTTPA